MAGARRLAPWSLDVLRWWLWESCFARRSSSCNVLVAVRASVFCAAPQQQIAGGLHGFARLRAKRAGNSTVAIASAGESRRVRFASIKT